MEDWPELTVKAEDRFWADFNSLLAQVVPKAGRPRTNAPERRTTRASRNSRRNWRQRRTVPDVDSLADILAAHLVNTADVFANRGKSLERIEKIVSAHVDAYLEKLANKINEEVDDDQGYLLKFLPSFIGVAIINNTPHEEFEKLDAEISYDEAVEYLQLFIHQSSEKLASALLPAIMPLLLYMYTHKFNKPIT